MRTSLFPLILAAAVLVLMITVALEKPGVSRTGALLWLLSSLAGSLINLPLGRLNAQPDIPGGTPAPLRQLLRLPEMPFSGSTILAVNVGAR